MPDESANVNPAVSTSNPVGWVGFLNSRSTSASKVVTVFMSRSPERVSTAQLPSRPESTRNGLRKGIKVRLGTQPAPSSNVADLAAGAGYFDQAHFGQEFRAFTGLTTH